MRNVCFKKIVLTKFYHGPSFCILLRVSYHNRAAGYERVNKAAQNANTAKMAENRINCMRVCGTLLHHTMELALEFSSKSIKPKFISQNDDQLWCAL